MEENSAVKKILVTLISLALSSAVCAQDFLQQWRDSATKGMNEFRSAHKAGIEANGWHFVAGAQSAEEVPVSDVFVKGVKAEKGSIRSAYLLYALYVPVPASESPEYQSAKMLVWFDCKEGSYEQHILEHYASADGSGKPVSRDAEKQGSAAIEIPGADPRSIEKPLLAAVCSAKL
jgi:hypothetical protein